jgi:hypothetical protein
MRAPDVAHCAGSGTEETSEPQVGIWRGGESGASRRYGVPRRDNQTVLDVVTYSRRRRDPTLAYRFACRVVLLLPLLCCQLASATEVEGVKLDEHVKLGTSELVLNGAGVRTRLIFKVYVGALYLPEKKSDAAEALVLKGPKRVSMTLLRELSAQQLIDALEDGIRTNHSQAEIAVLKARIEALVATMKEIGSAKAKTVIALDFVPESGTRITVDGTARGEPIPGEDFYAALLKIWLGGKPVDADLKKAMLGQGA